MFVRVENELVAEKFIATIFSKSCCWKREDKIPFQHNNYISSMSVIAMTKIVEFQYKLFSQPQYSTHLATCDFFSL